jgi:serine/threonine protein kinase
MARFSREARLLAALSHANIAAIYGLEESGGAALVMELAEGQTLAERLQTGALPVDEALHVARQVANALEAAHEKNIVHRDLKPANIKITPDGKVKVLDFGLAKALDADPIPAGSPQSSPTLSMESTRVGQILGTASYMSPEQARGKAVDKRADIWAFGVVLYEMLTGRRMFEGKPFPTRWPEFSAARSTWPAFPPTPRGPCGGCSSAACVAIPGNVCATLPTRGWRSTRRASRPRLPRRLPAGRRGCPGCLRPCSAEGSYGRCFDPDLRRRGPSPGGPRNQSER